MLHRSRGFTLIELLVALFVFSLLSGFAYRAVNSLLESQRAVAEEASTLAAAQKSFLFLERDIRQWVSARGELPLGDNALDIKAQGLTLHSSQGYSRYVLRDSVLYREGRPSGMAGGDVSMPLLVGIDSFAVNPLPADAGSLDALVGLEVLVKHVSLGDLQRVIYVGTAQPAPGFSSLPSDSPNPPPPSGGDTELPANH